MNRAAPTVADGLTVADLEADLEAVRRRSPLVHSITNLVVMNFTANALLAIGAAPVMAHAADEVVEMVGIADALVLNIGTLDPRWIESMQLALAAARAAGRPVVLDPVGAGATRYRNRALADLLAVGSPTVIRGNGSEVMSVAGLATTTRGVDSSASADAATDAAGGVAARLGCVVCVSGANDLVVDPAGRRAVLSNGHPWMTRVTGVGCAASALVAAFAAVQPDPWRATVAAMAVLGVVGELAVERVVAAGAGVGRLQTELLDGLQLLDPDQFATRLRWQRPADAGR